MKKLAFIISIILISNIYSEDCDDKDNASGYKDCKDLTLVGNNKYCCFFKNSYTYNGKSTEHKGCGSLTKEEYDGIKQYIELLKAQGKAEGYEYKIDVNCKSTYLQYYLTVLLLLIL